MRSLVRIFIGLAVAGLIVLAVLAVTSFQVDVQTKVSIEAPPSEVWNVLRDVERYPEWNPYIQSIEGEWQRGARIDVEVILPGGKKLEFPAIIKGVEDNYELRWEAELPVPRMLVGKHKLIMTTSGDGRTSLRNEQEFRGLLVGRFTESLLRPMGERFESMNEALKARVEAGYGDPEQAK